MFRSIRSRLGIAGKRQSVRQPRPFGKNARVALEVLEDRTAPTVAVAYVNQAWAGFSSGTAIDDADPSVAGNQAAIFGENAFANLQGGAGAIATGGTVTLLPGTYSEDASLTNPFTLNVLPGTATIGGALSGTPGLTKAGTGTLLLSGNNSYLGDTKVTRGVLQISSDSQLGSSAGVASVTSPGALEITGDTNSSRIFLLNNNATLDVDAGKTLTLSGAEIDGGNLSGPGTIAIAGANATSFNGTASSSSLTLTANANAAFNTFDNGGTLNLTAGQSFALSSFINTSSGKLFLNGTANVTDFVTNGQITVASTGKLVNVGSSGLTFGGGSVTTVNGTGAADNVDDGIINLGSSDALLAGGLMVNDGLVGSFTPGVNLVTDFGGVAKGSGAYGTLLTKNGGFYSPGNSPGTGSASGFNVNGGGTFQFELSNATGTAGTADGWDTAVVEPNIFNPTPTISYTATAAFPFAIQLVTRLDSGDYNTAGAAANFNPHQSYSWKFIDGSNPAVNVTGTFDPAAVTFVTTGFANPTAGTFSVATNDGGKSVFIVYTPTPIATTTALVASPLATTGGSLVSLTATVAPSPGALGTVTFLDQGVAIPGAANVPVVGGVATFTTAQLTAGSHPITAAYTGAGAYQNSASNGQTVVISGAAPAQPNVVSVTPNGNLTGFAGNQHSRVVNLTVVFDRPVQLDTNAIALALHTNNVTYNGVLQPQGYGTAPTSLVVNSTDNITWTVTFSGNTELGADGFASLKDGVYDVNIDATKVHPFGSPGVNMTGNSTTVIHRLFGDTGVPMATPNGSGTDYSAVVNTSDNLQFRTAFGKPAPDYKAYLDFNGDGSINTTDNLQFRTRFSKFLTWTV